MHALETIKILNAAHAEEAKQAKAQQEQAKLALEANTTPETINAYCRAVENAARF